MIDYIVVIYKNYDLLELQVENFKRLFPKKDYRLIVVEIHQIQKSVLRMPVQIQ
jgi:hypothetical protein